MYINANFILMKEIIFIHESAIPNFIYMSVTLIKLNYLNLLQRENILINKKSTFSGQNF